LLIAPGDVYNINEIGLFYCAQPNKTLSTRKNLWLQNQKDRPTLALVVNTTNSDKLRLSTNLYAQNALENDCQHIMCGGCNQMAWLTSYVSNNWMMSLHVHFKSQKWKVLLIINNLVACSFKHLGRGDSFAFST
jgi:hypothetical protein